MEGDPGVLGREIPRGLALVALGVGCVHLLLQHLSGDIWGEGWFDVKLHVG